MISLSKPMSYSMKLVLLAHQVKMERMGPQDLQVILALSASEGPQGTSDQPGQEDTMDGMVSLEGWDRRVIWACPVLKVLKALRVKEADEAPWVCWDQKVSRLMVSKVKRALAVLQDMQECLEQKV
mmetsp:Transcript_9060/g.30198  ORF Transcript_9060/g.30198 Transcript_9060/m.30198 type:complete len:126 (-) Transcript_9060:1511-1888(-)